MEQSARKRKFDLTINDVRRDWHRPPNLVSFVRLLLTIPVCMFILQPGILGWIGFSLFVIAAATDKLDGALARRNNGAWTTKLGKTIDPFIDKILVVAALATTILRCEGELRTMVIVATTIIILREIVVAIIKSRQVVKSASQAGRFSMVAQSVAVATLLMPTLWSWQPSVVTALLWLAVGASLCSAWVYWVDWRRQGT